MKAAYDGYSFKLSGVGCQDKVHFKNRYGIELAGDLYVPGNAGGKLAAIAVCGPFGAVKEQAAGLYADELAKRGFAAVAFDPSFIGGGRGSGEKCGVPGHQHGGFLRCGGLPLHA